MIKKIIISLFLLPIFIFLANKNVKAQTPASCDLTVSSVTVLTTGGGQRLVATVTANNIVIDGVAQTAPDDIAFYINVVQNSKRYYIPAFQLVNGTYSGSIDQDNGGGILFPDSNLEYTIQLVRDWGAFTNHTTICSATVKKTNVFQCSESDLGPLNVFISPLWNRGTAQTIRIVGAPAKFYNQTVYFLIKGGTSTTPVILSIDTSGNAQASVLIDNIAPNLPNGNYQATIQDTSFGDGNNCTTPRDINISGTPSCLAIGKACTPGGSIPPLCNNYVCTCSPTNPTSCSVTLPQLSTFKLSCIQLSPPRCILCEFVVGKPDVCKPSPPESQAACNAECRYGGLRHLYICHEGTPDVGINSAIGCIPIKDTNLLVTFFLQRGLALAGGIAILLFIFGGIQIMTSKGDEEKLLNGKNLITASIFGLVILIFGIFVLRLIGISVLGVF